MRVSPNANRTSPKNPSGSFFDLIREKNPDRPIILICDNFSSHFADYVDNVADRLDIRRVRLPRYAPDLNPIEQVWKTLKRDLSPREASDLETWHRLIVDRFETIAERLSFAESWMDRFLDVQKLCL
ncbi:transposase [Halomicrobium zhouii]|uniref:transposase n=1 Tax=Halomicrobium zhouii TaxID=767519 RepID=UPI00373FC92C